MLRVLSPGMLATVQDLGRAGYEQYGVPVSGAMDWFGLRAANRLVGNDPDKAVLEFAVQAPALQTDRDCLVAATGQGFYLYIQGRSVGLWRAAFVRRGEVIHFTERGQPGWCYLAVAGGIDVPPVMGSRSTYLRGGFGGYLGRLLQTGDVLPTGSASSIWIGRAGDYLPEEKRKHYSERSVPVILGPQQDFFAPETIEHFLTSEYLVSATSDRMGYRLIGPALPAKRQVELISEGMALGSVQVPPDGQPILMLSDRPTTGGYPKVATVARVGLPRVAQAMPGSGKLRFTAVDLEWAQTAYRNMLDTIDNGVVDDED